MDFTNMTNDQLLAIIAQQQELINSLEMDAAYGCLSRKGLERRYCNSASKDIVFLDLDGMHDANAKYGYTAVDQKIADSLSVIRSEDTLVGRWYSGDEIVLAVDCAAGMLVAERLRQAFIDNGLSATFGVVANSTSESLTDSVKRASHLVQDAKNNNVRGVIISQY